MTSTLSLFKEQKSLLQKKNEYNTEVKRAEWVKAGLHSHIAEQSGSRIYWSFFQTSSFIAVQDKLMWSHT